MIVGCGLSLWAGFWQLGKAEEKRVLFNAFASADADSLLAGPVTDDKLDDNLYRRLRISGRFLAKRQILLDNMMHDGRPGYHVLTPLLTGGQIVLVNRGWVRADADRNVLPDVTVQATMRAVTGRLNRLPRAGFTLAAVPAAAGDDWPRRLSFPTAADIAAQLGRPVYDYQLLLDPEEENGFVRDWRPNLMPPEKHLAYAIQWFMISATVLIIYVTLSIRAPRRMKRHGQSE